MQWLGLLQSSLTIYLVVTAIFGLLIGSFLNVVIYRLPIMMERQWLQSAKTYFQQNNLPYDIDDIPTRYNLITPRSCCPQCQKMIQAYDNIPIISFILLRGKCRACAHPISWRYPFIEFLTALVSIIVAYRFGFSVAALFTLIFSWSLIALTFIDIDYQILPDNITLPLLWLGLAVNFNGLFTTLQSAVLGAMLGYLFLWLLYWIFRLLTGKEGMGYGDFKLLAALGAWMGWQSLPLIVLLSSIPGLFFGLALILIKKHSSNQPFAFGPFLAISGWFSLLWGDRIIAFYLSTLHLP